MVRVHFYPDHGRVFQGIVPLAYHMCFLVRSSGRTKELSGAPLEKSLQSHGEDHEMSTDQPGLRQSNFSFSFHWVGITRKALKFE